MLTNAKGLVEYQAFSCLFGVLPDYVIIVLNFNGEEIVIPAIPV
jgi:hypothetical protein